MTDRTWVCTECGRDDLTSPSHECTETKEHADD